MSNKFTLASVVVAHLLVAIALTGIGGCKSTGFRNEPARNDFGGFGGPGEVGASGVMANPAKAAAAAEPAPAPASPASAPAPAAASEAAPAPASEPAAAPGAEPAAAPGSEPAPAPVSEAKPAAPVADIKPVGEGRTYVVKPGESIWVIARREKVSEADLLAANNLKRNTTLRAGQKLVIPAASAAKAEPASTSHSAAPKADVAVSGDVYVVKKGDVLSLIARKLGCTTAALREANGIKGDSIREGQKLRVPAGAKPKAGVTTASAAKPAAEKANGSAAKPAAKPAAPAAASSSAPAPAPAGAPALIDLAPMGSGSAPAPVTAAPAPAPSSAAPAPAAAPESIEAIPASR